MARKGVLCSDIYKWLDIVFFSGKEVKRKVSSSHSTFTAALLGPVQTPNFS